MKPVKHQCIIQFEDEAFMYKSEQCEIAGYFSAISEHNKREYRHFFLMTPNRRYVQHTESYIDGVLDESYIDIDIMNLPWAVQTWYECVTNGTLIIPWDRLFPGYAVREA